MGISAREPYKPLGAFLGRSRANGIASGRGTYFFPRYVGSTLEFCEAAHMTSDGFQEIFSFRSEIVACGAVPAQ